MKIAEENDRYWDNFNKIPVFFIENIFPFIILNFL